MTVRRICWSHGFRYRLHRSDLPGSPDLVFPSLGKVIFVHGCFWHRHSCRQGQCIPKTRRKFWSAKFESNVRRDWRVISRLRRAGWSVMVVWQCQTNPSARDRLERRLLRFLGA